MTEPVSPAVQRILQARDVQSATTMSMTREHLEAQFAERGMPHAGGLLVLAPDAIELVRAAEREDIPILGVDGFFISPTETISPLEHLADFSAAAATGRGTWRDAEGFIASRRTLGLTFEVTLGEPLLPAG